MLSGLVTTRKRINACGLEFLTYINGVWMKIYWPLSVIYFVLNTLLALAMELTGSERDEQIMRFIFLPLLLALKCHIKFNTTKQWAFCVLYCSTMAPVHLGREESNWNPCDIYCIIQSTAPRGDNNNCLSKIDSPKIDETERCPWSMSDFHRFIFTIVHLLKLLALLSTRNAYK